MDSHISQTDTNFNYYHQYCRLHLANVVLTSQMRELINERNELTNKFSKLDKKTSQIYDGEKSQQNRQKRFRRTADQIQRHYRCPVKVCQRSYGSQGSLNQHIKLKHQQIYEKMDIFKDGERSENKYSEHFQSLSIFQNGIFQKISKSQNINKN